MSLSETLYIFKEAQGLPLHYFWGDYNDQGDISFLSEKTADYIRLEDKPNYKLEDLFFDPQEFSYRQMLDLPDEDSYGWITKTQLGKQGNPFVLIYSRESQDRFSFYAILFSIANMEYLLDIMGKFYNFDHYSQDQILSISSKGIILSVNQSTARSLGFRKEELYGHALEKILISPSNPDSIFDRLRKEPSIQNMEICLRGRLGDTIGLAFAYGVKDLRGNLTKVMLFIRNISEQVETMSQFMRTSMELTLANEELKEAQVTLVNQEKMASVGLLAAGLAHEINNPLGYISNNIRVMEDYFRCYDSFIEECAALIIDNPEKQKVYEQMLEKHEIPYIQKDFGSLSSEINEGVDRIGRLLESLKVFSQKEKSGLPDYHDIRQALESLVDLTYNEYKYDLKIQKHFEEIPLVYCHLMSLNQALFNIFMNAVEAIKDQENLESGWIQISTFTREDMVYVQFKDNGGGIPENVIEHVKEPFFTTKKVGKGTGLGLSIAHEIIVEKHGGILDIQNHEEGTEILIGLPIIRDIEGEDE